MKTESQKVYESIEIKMEGGNTQIYKKITLVDAEAIAEKIRIANPDQCVNINCCDGDFVAKISWNDQMREFLNYKPFTKEGRRLKLEALKGVFTFKTKKELDSAEAKGYIEEYEIVRVEFTTPTSNNTYDLPMKSLEEFNEQLLTLGNDGFNLINAYPDKMSYDLMDNI